MAYVYKHIRLDNNTIFYIGIGSDKKYKRAHSKSNRNLHWKRIIKKYDYCVEIINENILFNEAKKIEIDLILKYGRVDLGTGTLVNLTSGGDGVIGLIQSKKHKRKNSESNKNRKLTIEHKENIKKGMLKKYGVSCSFNIPEIREKNKQFLKGNKRSDETKKKISESRKGKYVGKDNNFFGKTHTDEVKEKIRISRLGKKHSNETKKKISESNKGKIRHHNDNTKNKMRISAINRKLTPPSQKGKIWINNNINSKLIKKEDFSEYINDGWVMGRNIKK